MRQLALVIPVLRRPHRIRPLIDSIQQATSCDHRILFVATVGDDAVIDAVNDCGADLELIEPNGRGDYAKKINRGFQVTSEPWMFLGADDLHFHAGWFEACRRHFGNPAIGVIGTVDLANRRVTRGNHATHSLVRRAYVDECGTIDEPGKVLHEGYLHEFVDDEFVETAKKRGAFVHEPDSIVEHLHPMVGKAPLDPLYEASRARMRSDRRVLHRRRRLWT